MTVGRSSSFGMNVFLTLFISAVFVLVASYLFVLLMGYGFIFFTPEGFALSMRFEKFPVLTFFFVLGFYTPELPVGAVFALIWIVYAFSFMAAWRWRESFHSVLEKSFSRPFRSLFRNFLFIMPLLSSMIFTAVFAIIYSQEAVGVPTGQPLFPPATPSQEIFLELAYAPVIEELAFRLAPIGLFMIFHVFLTARTAARGSLKLLVMSVLYPEGAKKMAGLRNVSQHGISRGISGGEWAMIIATTFIFAIAHVISGVGWEVGKITSVLVQGFFLGLTYIVYGFEAPILLHWFFNYYLFFFDPDIVSKFFPGTNLILSLTELLIIGLGIFGWIMFAIAGLQRLIRRKTPTKQEVPAPPAILAS